MCDVKEVHCSKAQYSLLCNGDTVHLADIANDWLSIKYVLSLSKYRIISGKRMHVPASFLTIASVELSFASGK